MHIWNYMILNDNSSWYQNILEKLTFYFTFCLGTLCPMLTDLGTLCPGTFWPDTNLLMSSGPRSSMTGTLTFRPFWSVTIMVAIFLQKQWFVVICRTSIQWTRTGPNAPKVVFEYFRSLYDIPFKSFITYKLATFPKSTVTRPKRRSHMRPRAR